MNTQKVAYYMRAIHDNHSYDLQNHLDAVLNALPKPQDTEVTFGNKKTIRIQNRTKRSDFLLLHLGGCVKGQLATTMNQVVTQSQDTEGATSAPRGTEFKEGAAFLLIKDCHVLVCCSREIRWQRVDDYLSQLLQKGGLTREQSKFNLQKNLNTAPLEVLKREGARSLLIDRNVQSLLLSNPKEEHGFMQSVTRFLETYFKEEPNYKEMRQLEDLQVRVEFRLDGNTRACEHSQNFIDALSLSELADGELEEGMTLITKKNHVVRLKDVTLHKPISVMTRENTICHNSAWERLSAYWKELKRDNITDHQNARDFKA